MTDRFRDDRGTGVIGSTVGITVFLAFLLFATQLLFGLYTRSVVTSVAYDGAHAVAGARSGDLGGPAATQTRARAEQRMIEQLGPAGRRAAFDWSGTDADNVVLRVQLDAPRLFGGRLAVPLATDHIDRTVRVRIEADR